MKNNDEITLDLKKKANDLVQKEEQIPTEKTEKNATVSTPNIPKMVLKKKFKTPQVIKYHSKTRNYIRRSLEYINYVSYHYDKESSLLSQKIVEQKIKEAKNKLNEVKYYLDTYEISYENNVEKIVEFEVTTKSEKEYASLLEMADKLVFKIEGLQRSQVIDDVSATDLYNKIRKALAKASERIIREKSKLMKYKKAREERKKQGIPEPVHTDIEELKKEYGV